MGELAFIVNNNQLGTSFKDVELFGPSWMRDLMVAKQYAPSAWVQSNSKFKGTVDANHGYTPRGHATHDLGMAMDLSIADYIGDALYFGGNAVSQAVQQTHLINPGRWTNNDASSLLQAIINASANRERT